MIAEISTEIVDYAIDESTKKKRTVLKSTKSSRKAANKKWKEEFANSTNIINKESFSANEIEKVYAIPKKNRQRYSKRSISTIKLHRANNATESPISHHLNDILDSNDHNDVSLRMNNIDNLVQTNAMSNFEPTEIPFVRKPTNYTNVAPLNSSIRSYSAGLIRKKREITTRNLSADHRSHRSHSGVDERRPPTRQCHAFPINLEGVNKLRTDLLSFNNEMRIESTRLSRRMAETARPPSRHKPPSHSLFLEPPSDIEQRFNVMMNLKESISCRKRGSRTQRHNPEHDGFLTINESFPLAFNVEITHGPNNPEKVEQLEFQDNNKQTELLNDQMGELTTECCGVVPSNAVQSESSDSSLCHLNHETSDTDLFISRHKSNVHSDNITAENETFSKKNQWEYARPNSSKNKRNCTPVCCDFAWSSATREEWNQKTQGHAIQSNLEDIFQDDSQPEDTFQGEYENDLQVDELPDDRLPLPLEQAHSNSQQFNILNTSLGHDFLSLFAR